MILPRLTSRADPVTAWAKSVAKGAVAAGPHVRAACARHLRDLIDAPGRGFSFDKAAAARALNFFPDVLRLAGGEHEGRPFELVGWQQFIVGSLFGWKGADGYRRFRVAFCESGKGSGKSPLAAGIGLYMLVADDEARAEVYAAASKKDQAMVLFRDAVAMVRQSPGLNARLGFSGGAGREWNIAYFSTGSWFRPISSDDGQSGPRPHCALLDEIHEHRDSNMVEMLRAGTKGRRQALIFMITNSGLDRQSVCYQYHDYATKVAAGQIQDDAFFALVCALDEGDDPFKDPSCWIKANPSLGTTIPPKYLEEQVVQARGMPAKESIVRRLNFCEWVDAESPWIAGDLWRSCEASFDLAELDGSPCYGGLDLSGTRDLTAFSLVFPRDDGNIDAAVWFWTPGDTVQERARADRVPYDAWERAGDLIAPPGRAVDYAYVARALGDLQARFEVRGVGFDPYRIKYLEQALDAEGVALPLTPHGQGYYRAAGSGLWMPHSVDLLEKAVLDGRLRVRRNPVLTWNSASAVLVADAKGNRTFDKRRSTGRIDGVVALCMAIGTAFGEPVAETSVYELMARGIQGDDHA